MDMKQNLAYVTPNSYKLIKEKDVVLLMTDTVTERSLKAVNVKRHS
jgi:hypothetical protein